jgi:hypothetical protein
MTDATRPPYPPSGSEDYQPVRTSASAPWVARLRMYLAHRLHPYWTQTEIDAAQWRGHEHWIAAGFGVKHHVDEPCPAQGDLS